jgi:aspartyl aminopeptidase
MMFQDKEQFNLELTQFLDTSPTPFHAVSSMVSMFEKAGFTQLCETEEWALTIGSKYFVTRNGSSMIAFIVGQDALLETGIKMVGAHTDSPAWLSPAWR